MKRCVAVAGALVFLGMAGAVSANQSGDRCREGTGDLGIGMYVCDGGSCEVSVQLSDGRITHRFSVEPRISQIDPNGPSFKKLENNDVLVAVDGFLVTTPEGGFQLANAKIGVPIKLRVRRGKEEIGVSIVPAKGCNLPGLSVVH